MSASSKRFQHGASNRSFAFLDVDATLYYGDNPRGGAPQVNEALLDELLEKGVKDVYLFTNMSLDDIAMVYSGAVIFTRHQLVEHLQAKGFKVHGVITPADTGYYDEQGHYPIGAAYRELYEPLYEPALRRKKAGSAQTLEEQVDYHWNRYLWKRADAITKMRIETAKGQSREVALPTLIVRAQENVVTCTDRASLKTALQQGGRPEQGVSEQRVTISGTFSDNKALMMYQAAEELTARYGNISVFYADDTQSHLDGAEEAVMQFNKDNSFTVRLTTLKMPREFEVASNEESQTAYSESIAKHNINVSINSSMRDIANYAEFLKQDTRIHALRVEGKGVVLAELARELQSAKSLQELNGTLNVFFEGENSPNSRYAILNRGQGLTTRALGFFNLLDTDTIRKLKLLRDRVREMVPSVQAVSENQPLLV